LAADPDLEQDVVAMLIGYDLATGEPVNGTL